MTRRGLQGLPVYSSAFTGNYFSKISQNFHVHFCRVVYQTHEAQTSVVIWAWGPSAVMGGGICMCGSSGSGGWVGSASLPEDK